VIDGLVFDIQNTLYLLHVVPSASIDELLIGDSEKSSVTGKQRVEKVVMSVKQTRRLCRMSVLVDRSQSLEPSSSSEQNLQNSTLLWFLKAERH